MILKAIAAFMERARGGRVRFEEERVVMSGGATGANETLMFCLADRGDAFLVPTPYYAAYVFFLIILSLNNHYFINLGLKKKTMNT